MRKYEMALVLDPDLKEEERKKLLEEIKKLLEKAGGKILKMDEWGKRELAYQIRKAGRKFQEGVYFLFELEFIEKFSAGIGEKLRQNEKVLRYLLVKKE